MFVRSTARLRAPAADLELSTDGSSIPTTALLPFRPLKVLRQIDIDRVILRIKPTGLKKVGCRSCLFGRCKLYAAPSRRLRVCAVFFTQAVASCRGLCTIGRFIDQLGTSMCLNK